MVSNSIITFWVVISSQEFQSTYIFAFRLKINCIQFLIKNAQRQTSFYFYNMPIQLTNGLSYYVTRQNCLKQNYERNNIANHIFIMLNRVLSLSLFTNWIYVKKNFSSKISFSEYSSQHSLNKRKENYVHYLYFPRVFQSHTKINFKLHTNEREK